jgi:3-oxoacyl-(acyl-carrier-protein) synthase
VYDTLAPCFYNMQPFLYVHVIGKVLGLRGFCTAVHNACSSGAFALEIAAQHIRSGQADVMVVLGAECFDTGVRLEWFRRLGLYALDPSTSRPFDAASRGFFVGEGGAAIVLESAGHASKRGARSYAEYLGGAFTHQAWKQTIPDVRAARLRGVIEEALRGANLRASDVDLVVPHGAGATLSDGYETACLEAAWGTDERRAVAAAFKPAVGHLLAASAIMETICSLLVLKHGHIPRSLTPAGPTNFPVSIPQQGSDRKLGTLLKLSTGFTGHDAALVFRTA